MRAAYPEAPEEADNDIREDGTAAHWLSHQILQGFYPKVGSVSPNDRTLTEEMFDGVDMYHDALRELVPARVKMLHEVPVALDVIYPGMKGTPDAHGYDPVENIIYIADFKFGFRFVEVWHNWQMMCYALGIIEQLKLRDTETRVRFIICQPRSYHHDGPVRFFDCYASELRPYWNQLIGAAHEAMGDRTTCRPNPGCTDCAGRHACTALQNAAYSALEVSSAGVPLELSPLAAGDELRHLKAAHDRLSARITGLETQVEHSLRRGEFVPHWSLTASYARETWRDGAESQILGLGSLYNVDLSKPRKPVSPAQARKLIPASVVAALAHKPSTGVRLTATDPLEARKKFSPNRSTP